MPETTYLIIGGGITGDAAVKGIRKEDPQGSIELFSYEPDLPYSRPPLTKALWTGKKRVEDIGLKTPRENVNFHLNTRVTRVDPETRSVEDQHGNRYSYQKLLLATGGKPRRLPFPAPGILYYRTLNDYRALREAAKPGKEFVVIGGGFIGSEISAGLAMAGCRVTMVFPEDAIGARVYPRDLAHFLNDYFEKKGVRVLSSQILETIRQEGEGYRVQIKDGAEIRADGVVAGIGIQPNTQLAEEAGLTVENGIVVDDALQTSHANIFAAGDVANFYNSALSQRMRVEHEDNAIQMGQAAGQNMAREQLSKPPEAYDYLPYFYSDLFELGYEAVGLLDARLEIVADWQKLYQKGVLYYLDQNRVKGVLLWNVWDKVPAARNLIAGPGNFDARSVRGSIPF